MKTKFILILFSLLPVFATTQQSNPDDLKRQLVKTQHDSVRYEILGKLSDFYIEKKIDSALFFTIVVSASKKDDSVKIRVKDNGNGIPKKILDKVFQPFSTPKPTGQGTGLGLSLRYDIVKAHGRVIKIEDKERKGKCIYNKTI